MDKNQEVYYNGDGLHREKLHKLMSMIPAAGPVIKSHKHPKLERLRKASNCYTDLYHNDLVNLSKSFAHIFGIRSSDYRETISKFSPRLYLLVEKSMDRFILEAWSEQYDAIRG